MTKIKEKHEGFEVEDIDDAINHVQAIADSFNIELTDEEVKIAAKKIIKELE